MKARAWLSGAMVSVLVASAACAETDDFSTDCEPVTLEGLWENRDAPWWQFDLRQRPFPPGVIQLRGTYITDYLYHLEGFQDADTLRGSLQGGSSCLSLGARFADHVVLDFQLLYPGHAESCRLDGSIELDGPEIISVTLSCANHDQKFKLHRPSPRSAAVPGGAIQKPRTAACPVEHGAFGDSRVHPAMGPDMVQPRSDRPAGIRG